MNLKLIRDLNAGCEIMKLLKENAGSTHLNMNIFKT